MAIKQYPAAKKVDGPLGEKPAILPVSLTVFTPSLCGYGRPDHPISSLIQGWSGQRSTHEMQSKLVFAFPCLNRYIIFRKHFIMIKPTLVFALSLVLTFGGCLTVKQKEYRIKLYTDNSGEASIRFIGISSASDDSTDVSADDFRYLVEYYFEGTLLEQENPGFHNLTKNLYEEDGKLVGDISFSFDSLGAVRLFRFDAQSPLMYYVGADMFSEQLVETNGRYDGDRMPVVFWPRGTKELYLRTEVISDAPYQRSLLSTFREWRSHREVPEPREEH